MNGGADMQSRLRSLQNVNDQQADELVLANDRIRFLEHTIAELRQANRNYQSAGSPFGNGVELVAVGGARTSPDHSPP